MTLEYRQSLKEVNTILEFMGIEYINKLPEKLNKFIKENMDNTYISNINVNTPIDKQELKNDTKILLSLIYRNYWCSQEKKEELLEEDRILKNKYENELREKYNPENIFKDKKQNVVNEEVVNNSVAMTVYKETIFKRIINKIKMLFKR